jgi:hypothetical protein
MNANELADKLMSSLTMEYDCDEYMEQAATMLRQQQAEIEALKMGFAGNGTSDSELAEVRAMANRQFLEIQALKQIIDANNLSQNIGQFVKPAKTLTDEEIIETVKDHFIGAIKLGIVLTNDNVLSFARAILRKAQ